jgi:hypothetical protein
MRICASRSLLTWYYRRRTQTIVSKSCLDFPLRFSAHQVYFDVTRLNVRLLTDVTSSNICDRSSLRRPRTCPDHRSSPCLGLQCAERSYKGRLPKPQFRP